MNNTVLSLSTLQKYDNRPFIVCVVTPDANHMMLANPTFLKKVSHSSQKLRVDNIRGSFNGSDIMLDFYSIKNEPNNFRKLFDYHTRLFFQDNIKRLVESTNAIEGRDLNFSVTLDSEKNIFFVSQQGTAIFEIERI
ncbi:MAG: hypothetical protein NC120_10965 [Ruminococcus sp.]|nr:hypothetical protein [Ruminococcus sp.]